MRPNPDAEGALFDHERYVTEIAEAGAVWARKMIAAAEDGGERAQPRLMAAAARMLVALLRADLAGVRREARSIQHALSPAERAELADNVAKREARIAAAYDVARRIDADAHQADRHEARGWRALHFTDYTEGAAVPALRTALGHFRDAIAHASDGRTSLAGNHTHVGLQDVITALKRAGLPSVSQQLRDALENSGMLEAL